MRYYEEELEVLIKAGAKVVEVASFEWERVHGFANYVAEDLNIDWYSWSSVSGLKVWAGDGFKVINPDCVTLPQVLDYYIKAENEIAASMPYYFKVKADDIGKRLDGIASGVRACAPRAVNI